MEQHRGSDDHQEQSDHSSEHEELLDELSDDDDRVLNNQETGIVVNDTTVALQQLSVRETEEGKDGIRELADFNENGHNDGLNDANRVVDHQNAHCDPNEELIRKVTEAIKEICCSDVLDNLRNKQSCDELVRVLTGSEEALQMEKMASLLFEIADYTSVLQEKLRPILISRTLYSNVIIPQEASQACDKILKIFGWNVGPTTRCMISIKDQAVLFVLTSVVKADIIFLQESRTIWIGNIIDAVEEYNYIRLTPNMNNSWILEKGLYILFRKELTPCLFNAAGKITTKCKHNNNNGVVSTGKDCEYVAVSIKMNLTLNGRKQEVTRRLVNFYHGSFSKPKQCKANVPPFLSQAFGGDVALLMADGNFRSTGNVYYTNYIANELDMTNVMPEFWATFWKKSRPDLVFTNIGETSNELVVHKPIQPYDLLNQVINNPNLDLDLVAKVKEIANVAGNVTTTGACHHLLVAELGEGANDGNRFHCCYDQDKMSNNQNMLDSPAQIRPAIVKTIPIQGETPKSRGLHQSRLPDQKNKGCNKPKEEEERFHCGEKCQFVVQLLRQNAAAAVQEAPEAAVAKEEDEVEVPLHNHQDDGEQIDGEYEDEADRPSCSKSAQ